MRYSSIRPALHSMIAAAFVFAAMFSTESFAQNHFIGEGQSANRVIKLRSTGTKQAAAKVAENVTSRGDRVARQTTAIANPNQIKFDEIKVPRALREQMSPVVQDNRRPPTPNNFARPVRTTQSAIPAIQTGTSKTLSKTRPTAPLRTLESSERVSIKNNQVATEIHTPKFVNINESALMQVVLHNMGKEDVDNVKLVATLPAHAKFVSASPQPTQIQGHQLIFVVSNLRGERQQKININVAPTQKLPIELATQVVMENKHSTIIGVKQPQLSVSIDGPRQTTTGKTLNHIVRLKNIGDGVAKNVRLESVYPSGFQYLKSSLNEVVSLEPGQALDIQLDSRALAPGQGQLKVAAKSSSTEVEQTALDVMVFEPELRVSAVGPKINFVDRDGIYSINIENTGEVEVTDVDVSLVVPAGMKVTTISRQAEVDAVKGTLSWKFPRLSAKTSEQIQLKATAIEEGEQVCNIRIKSNETVDKEVMLATQVSTRADVSVRIKNVTGPVQVGGKANFVVEVENHGSRQASEINVVVELPESLMAVKNSSATGQYDNKIVFEQPMIGAGEKVEFKFSAMGVAKGDQVVRSVLEMNGRRTISEDSVYVYEVDEARISESLSPVIPR